MAGDYVPMDHDLPDKPEVIAIIEATKTRVEDVFFRLFKLWRLADGQTRDGRIEKCGPFGLARRCGGNEDFWLAVSKVTATTENPEGWLQFKEGAAIVPRFSERFRKCAKLRREESRERKRIWRERKKAEKNAGQTWDKQRDKPLPEPEPEPEPEPGTPTESQPGYRGGGRVGSGLDFNFNGQWPDIKRIANEISHTLWPTRRALPKEQDQDNLLRVAALSIAVFSEDWLRSSVRETAEKKGARDSLKYLNGILRRKASEAGKDFDSLLDSMRLPVKPTPSKPKPEPT